MTFGQGSVVLGLRPGLWQVGPIYEDIVNCVLFQPALLFMSKELGLDILHVMNHSVHADFKNSSLNITKCDLNRE